jgi:hypothetical protein
VEALKGVHQTCISINLSSAVTEVYPSDYIPTIDSPPPPPYTSFFTFSTAGSNQYNFSTWSSIQCNNWIAAIRLSHFEQLKIFWLLTCKLLYNVEYKWAEFGMEPFKTGIFRGEVNCEGVVFVMPQYVTKSKSMFAVVTSSYVPPTFYSKLKKARQSDTSKRGTILFFSSKGKKKPAFLMERCNRVVIDLKGDILVFGVLTFPTHVAEEEEIFGTMVGGEFQVVTHQNMEDLGTLKDQRPRPAFVKLSCDDVHKWIISILGAFSIDSSPEDESIQFSNPEWPSSLYLSLDDIGGISMQTYELNSFILFQHYLNQKFSFGIHGKLLIWSQSIAKGSWERKIIDRKEAEFKLIQFLDWIAMQKMKLISSGIVLDSVSPLDVIHDVSEIVPNFRTALVSLMGDHANIQNVQVIEVTDMPKEIINEEQLSGSDGSLSDSGSSDGSSSQEEVPLGFVKIPSNSDDTNSPEKENLEDDETAAVNIYAEHSLLHKLEASGPKTSKHFSAGPLINAIQVF